MKRSSYNLWSLLAQLNVQVGPQDEASWTAPRASVPPPAACSLMERSVGVCIQRAPSRKANAGACWEDCPISAAVTAFRIVLC